LFTVHVFSHRELTVWFNFPLQDNNVQYYQVIVQNHLLVFAQLLGLCCSRK